MNINSKITTFICFIGIALLFLSLGYASVLHVEPAKVDKQTLFQQRILNLNNKISDLTEKFYIIQNSIIKGDFNQKVIISDVSGTNEEISTADVIIKEFDALKTSIEDCYRRTDLLIESEYGDKYNESINNTKQALDILDENLAKSSEISDLEDLSPETIEISREIISNKDKNSGLIRIYLKKSLENLKSKGN